jgi:hypothetical protein
MLDDLVQDMIWSKEDANAARKYHDPVAFARFTKNHDEAYKILCKLHREVSMVNDLIREASYA